MSIYQKASLVQIPSGYKAADDKLYSVVPNNGDGDFTVTVDADATRVNKDGLIESVAADQARLNYNFIDGVVQPDPHLLLEPSRTNQILYSEDLTNSVWQKISGGTGTSPVVTANYSVAPDGSNTADRVVMDMGSGTSINDYSIIRNFGTSGSTGTNSVYIKSNTSDSYTLGIDNTGQVETITVTPQWQRFSYSVTNSDRLQISLRGGGQTVSVYADVSMWGGSLENGDYLTSYIPTTTGAVTRTVDKCFNGGDVNLFNLTEGTFFIDVNPFIPSANTNIGISNGTDAQKIVFIFQSYGTQVRTYSSGGVSEFDNLTFNQRNKIAVSFKTNEYKIFINGTKVGTDTSASVPTGMNRLNFSNRSNSSSYFEGEIYQTMVFNEALSDTELEEITSYKSFGQMAKALLYTIE